MKQTFVKQVALFTPEIVCFVSYVTSEGGETEAAVPATPGQVEESSEEALLQRALAMSMDT